MDFSNSSVTEIEEQVSALREQLAELEKKAVADPENAENALISEVQEFLSSLNGIIAERKAKEQEQFRLERKAAEEKAAKAESSGAPTATGGVKKKKKKVKKDDDLANRAQSWQKFSAKSGRKKSIFASPEEGSNGRVGFHGSSNTMTAIPDRKKHEFTEN